MTGPADRRPTVSPAPLPVAPLLPSGVDTPALVIDLDIVERNARRLADALAERAIALRPHAKTHKSVALGKLQLGAGAKGLTVGNIGEAEVFAAGGVDDLFIAYPVWAEGAKAARVRDLHERPGLALRVGFDSIEGARRLAAAVSGSGRVLEIVLELDPGNRRTGAPPEGAGEIAAAARELGLNVLGVFTHGGHAYRPGGAEPAGQDEVRALATGADALRAEGIEPIVISAGSTPTQLTAAAGPVNEIRAGTYLLGDRQQWAIGAVPDDGIALAVAATVVSAAVEGQVVIDAGAKTLTKDVATYLTGHGVIPPYPDAIIERVSDYHGVVTAPNGAPLPKLGEVVAVIPNHVCPVVDLRDTFIATRSGVVIGTWSVDARGRSG
ncbi:MAG TPA: alanine racemase [Candidatus Limnocylindria bacterium]|nr:alanine racemase [Candidatus Limnocylindria bacterium]